MHQSDWPQVVDLATSRTRRQSIGPPVDRAASRSGHRRSIGPPEFECQEQRSLLVDHRVADVVGHPIGLLEGAECQTWTAHEEADHGSGSDAQAE